MAKTARATLADRYGLVLVDGPAPNTWLPAEAERLLGLLTTLPRPLQTLASHQRFGHIRVFKTLDAAPPGESHSAPAPLFWQLLIHLNPASDPDEAATLIERRFMHQFLHVYDAYYQTSKAAEWRSLSGWRPRSYLGIPVPLIPRDADNQDPRGYASPAGLEDAEEDFVTFGELYFVTPPATVEGSLACRIPAKYAYFRRLFPDYQPAVASLAGACKSPGVGFLDDVEFFDPVTRASIAMGPVDETTVEGFELLYATPGVADAAEVAGHLILRVRLRNNPEAERLGVENPHDLVLSFLADTEADSPPRPPRAPAVEPKECRKSWLDFADGAGDLHDFDALHSIVQSLKGLSGGFLTTFDRQTLGQTVKSYTVDQDRNLLRYRLNLSEAQRRSLISRLYIAKKNYKAKYYFFDRNCASILVQLIGEGIGDDEVAGFDPLVVPPNALVALLVRKGLASPVQPAFYGYRKKGQIAQEEIRDEIKRLQDADASVQWPRVEDFFSPDENVRAAAFHRLLAIDGAHPEFSRSLFRLAAFGQEAELAFTDHTQRCEDYTTKATATLRDLQRQILVREPRAGERYQVDVNRLIYARYMADEARDSLTGSSHTNLSAVYVGAGAFSAAGRTTGVAVASTALHRQAMGAMTSQSMQRATSVTLGGVTAVAGQNREGQTRLLTGRLTGLSLRKMKERLDEVPSIWDQGGHLGLGLTVLDLRFTSPEGEHGSTRTTWAQGELLLNLLSSRLYDRFLYVSAGTALETTFDNHATGLIFPLRLEGLWSFAADRSWQLRGETEMRYSVMAGKIGRELTASASLVHRLWEPHGTEVLASLGATLQQVPQADGSPGTETSLLQLGLEWNRW